MPLPEGWEWLDDLPDEWEYPPELEAPTPFPETNLVIKIVSCKYIGHDVRAAVGRFVSEHAIYTIWLTEVKGSGGTAKDMAVLGNIQQEQTRRAYEAWKAFDDVSGLSAPNEVLRERRTTAAATLAAVLTDGADTLARVRESQ